MHPFLFILTANTPTQALLFLLGTTAIRCLPSSTRSVLDSILQTADRVVFLNGAIFSLFRQNFQKREKWYICYLIILNVYFSSVQCIYIVVKQISKVIWGENFFLFIFFYFSITVDIQYYISFRCIAQWLDIYRTYKMTPL